MPYDAFQRLGAVVQRVADAAQEAGREAGATALRAGLAVAGDGAAHVVVAGETSAGKSHLINALVDRPGASPVRAEETTGCPIAFRHGEVEGAVAHFPDLVAGGLVARPIGLDRVASHAQVDSAEPAAMIDITLRAPLLESLALIDTPGVGGLKPGYARLNLELLQSADTLLFVHHPRAPLLTSELAFLEEAAAIVAGITIVATKTDVTPHYETVLAESRGHLATRPRLAHLPMLPVSTVLAEQAIWLAAEGHTGDAATATRLSGLPALTEHLRGTVAVRATRLRYANLARRTAALAAEIAADERRITAARADPDAIAALVQEADRLGELLSGETGTRITVSHLLQRLGADPKFEFDEVSATVKADYRGRVATVDRVALREVPRQLAGELGAAAAEATQRQAALARELAALVAERLDVPDAIDIIESVLADQPDAELELSGPVAPRRNLWTAVGGMGGVGRIAFSVAASAVSGPAGWIAAGGAGIGIATSLAQVWGLDIQQQRTVMRGWVDQAIADAQGSIGRDLIRRARAVQHHTEASMPTRLAALKARRQAVLNRATELKRSAQPDETAARHLEHLDKLSAQAEAVAQSLLRTTTAPPDSRRK
jgi:hypothetical protein